MDILEIDFKDGKWLRIVSNCGFDVSGVEPSCSVTTVLYYDN
jgi:hypothetical protein